MRKVFSISRCRQCGKERPKAERGWRIYLVGGEAVVLCPEHAPAFAMGWVWGGRDVWARTYELNERALEQVEDADGESEEAEEADEPTASTAGEASQRQRERRQRLEERLEALANFDLTPQQIHHRLDKMVAGQDHAKQIISTAVRGHYRRCQMRMMEEKAQIPAVSPSLINKENVLLLGPTGCGKTYLCQTLASVVNIPFWKSSLTSFTETGYVGNSVEDALSYLLPVSHNSMPLAEKGMLFLDELDKKARKFGGPEDQRDVSGEGVQTALLEMLDTKGSTVQVSAYPGLGRHPSHPKIEFDTRDVFFALGGAFVGLSDIIAKRMDGKSSMGFGRPPDISRDLQMRQAEILHCVEPEDLIAYGFIPELIGRIGCFVVLDPLSLDDLRRIMVDVDDAVVKQHVARATGEGFELEFDDKAVELICKMAAESGMGARHLRSLAHRAVGTIMYEMPTKIRRRKRRQKVLVTRETVANPSDYQCSQVG